MDAFVRADPSTSEPMPRNHTVTAIVKRPASIGFSIFGVRTHSWAYVTPRIQSFAAAGLPVGSCLLAVHFGVKPSSVPSQAAVRTTGAGQLHSGDDISITTLPDPQQPGTKASSLQMPAPRTAIPGTAPCTHDGQSQPLAMLGLASSTPNHSVLHMVKSLPGINRFGRPRPACRCAGGPASLRPPPGLPLPLPVWRSITGSDRRR